MSLHLLCYSSGLIHQVGLRDLNRVCQGPKTSKKPAGSLQKKPATHGKMSRWVMKRPASNDQRDYSVVEKGTDGEELRDRLKSRKFFDMWDHLPTVVRKAYYEAVSKCDANTAMRATKMRPPWLVTFFGHGFNPPHKIR